MGKVLVLGLSVFALFAMFKSPSEAKPDGDSAYGNPNHAMAFCNALDQSGAGAAPCEYGGFSREITVTLNLDAGEERTLCAAIKPTVQQANLDLKGWTLFVKTPYSNGPVTFCTL